MADDEHYFFFIVTTDGGKKISVSRSKGGFSDYVEVRGLITTGEEQREVLNSFTEEEKTAARLGMLLELSRAVMGYKTEKGVLEDIMIFKRIPITASLHEEGIFNLVWEVEAMLGSIYIVGAMAAHRHNLNTGK